MPGKERSSIVRSKPDGSFVLVHPDGHEEPYRAPPADWAKVDAMTDDDIARQIAENPDAAPEMTGAWFDGATVMRGDTVIRKGGRPKSAAPKAMVTLRLDPDVIAGFRAGGPGWQSRMNAVLRAAIVTTAPGSKTPRRAGKTPRTAASVTAKGGETDPKRAARTAKAGTADKRKA
jgi:uncharacterized protein (DUF4415 family)